MTGGKFTHKCQPQLDLVQTSADVLKEGFHYHNFLMILASDLVILLLPPLPKTARGSPLEGSAVVEQVPEEEVG